jgi:hypothetical protein
MDAMPAELIESGEAAIAQFLQHPQSAAFATHCAAYLRGLESLRVARSNNVADKSSAAAHEAGHCISAAALGIPLQGARLFEHESGWGGCVQPGPSSRDGLGPTPQFVGETIVCCLGGYCGEQLVGRSGLHTAAHEIGIVFYLCKASEQYFHGMTARAALRAGLTAAHECLRINESTFHRVRLALIRQTTIDSADLARCVASVEPLDPDKWSCLARSGGGSSVHPFEELCLDAAHALAPVFFRDQQ